VFLAGVVSCGKGRGKSTAGLSLYLPFNLREGKEEENLPAR
jgi:hypothetical protein